VSTTPVLEVHDAHKRFGDTTALAGAHLRVAAGEWVGLLGPNGAGKTTLVRAVASRVRLDAGRISVDGRRSGLVPQAIALYPFLTARENLEVFGRLHGLARGPLAERVRWALHWTDLSSRADERTATFSGGMQRRLNLACGVLHDPHLVLLDEPTTGVDPQSRERIFSMLGELRDRGAALLHTTHQLGEAESVCQRVVIIDHGRVVAEGTPAELVERTLGHTRGVVITLDRPPDAASVPPGTSVQGRTLHAGMVDLGAGLADLLGRVRAAGFDVEDVRVVRPDLHAVFLHLTGREVRE
jgi:ABC-2 type transport system ATP-binding protein